MKKVIDLNMMSQCCTYDNCRCRTFYVVRQRNFLKHLKGKSDFDTPFRIMLICTRCGSPEVYGD